MSIFQSTMKQLNLNRVNRIRVHQRALLPYIKTKTKKEKKELAFFNKKFDEHYRQARLYIVLRLVCYVFLYASVVLNFVHISPYLQIFAAVIKWQQAFIGTTVLLALVIWMTLKINLEVELLNEILSHIINLYYKDNKRDSDKVIEGLKKTL